MGEDGRANPQDVVDAVRLGETVLTTVMHSNNEVGAINNIREIVRLVKEKDQSVLIHTDAAQSVGKVPVRVRELVRG